MSGQCHLPGHPLPRRGPRPVHGALQGWQEQPADQEVGPRVCRVPVRCQHCQACDCHRQRAHRVGESDSIKLLGCAIGFGGVFLYSVVQLLAARVEKAGKAEQAY